MANTGNTQQQINYGAAANDGQGDPLRTAFIKTDDNFDAIWNTGPVGSNITILNNTIQSNNTNGNIVLRPNGVGVIQANAAIIPNATNLRDLGTVDQRFRAAYIGTGGLSVDGNVTVTGNLTAGNISYTGNVFVGDLQGSVYADDSTIMVDAVDNAMFSDSATFGEVITTQITNQSPINIQTNGGGAWQFAGNILRGPEGGSWQSAADTIFLSSPANGYITLQSTLGGNTVSELFMEHSFIRFLVDNGGPPVTWQMNLDGSFAMPNYSFPAADGAADQVLKTYGNGILYWDSAGSDYGNANVAEYLISDFGTFGSNTVVTAGNIVASVLDVSAIQNQFPIGIQTDNGYVWQFAGNILRSPEGGTWQSSAGTEFISSNANGFINLIAYSAGNLATELYMEHGFVRIRVDNGGPEQDWNFRVNGVLDVPGDIIPQSNGTASLGNSTNYWSNLWVANNTIYIGGVPLGISAGNVLTVNGEDVLSNDSDSSIATTGNISAGNILATGNMDANNLVVTNFADIGDISIAGGYITLVDGSASTGIDISPNPEGQAFLQVPNDATANTANLRVVNNAGNVRIETNAGTIWTFGYDGDLAAPGNISANAILTDNYFYANGEPFVSSSTGNITFTNTTMSPPDGVDLFITAANSEVEITGLDFRVEVTDDVRIQGNDIVSIRNTSNNEAITIRTDYNGNDYSWEFDATGNLTAPGSITVSGDITVAGDITGTSGASTLVLKAQPDSNTAIQLNNIVDSTISTVANLEVRTDVANTPRLWRFDTNGDLTVPNYINFKDGTFIGDEGGAGTPVFRVDSPLGLGIHLTTDSDITGNNYTWSFGIDGNLTTPGNISGNTAGYAIGYRDIPQVSFTGNATISTTDAGKHYYSTQSTDYTLTIANNASQGFQVGAAISVVNQGTGNITIAQGSGVTLYLAGNATSGNRTLTTFGMATIMKVATDTWFINGSGVV